MASAIWAQPVGEKTSREFPFTDDGVQEAMDFFAGTKGMVLLPPGELLHDFNFSIHGGIHLCGHGPGITVLKRAPGSFSGTSPAHYANSIITTAFGSNGTPNETLGTAQSNICISNLTLDGDYAANNVTFTSPGLITGHYGIKAFWTNHLRIYNVEVMNFLQTGIETNACRNVFVGKAHIKSCGKYASAASRNGLNFNNGYSTAIANGYGIKHTADQVIIEDCTDTNITLKNVNEVAMTNLTFDGALIGIEVEATASISTLLKSYAVSTVTASNITGNFLRLSPPAGVGFESMVFEGITCDFHPTLHGNNIATIWSGPIFLGRTNNAYVKAIKVRHGVFRNINSFSANSECGFVLMGLPGTTPSSDIELDGLTFYGANGAEHNTANKGMDLYGNLRDIRIRNCDLKDVEGIGIHVRPHGASAVLEDLNFFNNCIDGCQEDAYKCLVDIGGAVIRGVEFIECRAKNPAINLTSYRCFFVGASATTGTCEQIKISQSRGWRTSSVCNGIEVLQTGSSVVDEITLDRNNFTKLGSGHAVAIRTGAPTNVYFDDFSRKGNAIASAATIVCGRGDGFNITVGGVTTVDTITPHTVFDQRPKRFKAAGAITFSDGVGNLRLAGAWGPVTANDSLWAYYDTADAVWYEISRSGDV